MVRGGNAIRKFVNLSKPGLSNFLDWGQIYYYNLKPVLDCECIWYYPNIQWIPVRVFGKPATSFYFSNLI